MNPREWREARLGHDVGVARGVAIAAALVAAIVVPCFGDSILLKESIRLAPDQAEVRLGEVAALDGELALSLAETVVFTADPEATWPQTLRLGDLRDLLSERGVNMGLISLTGGECALRPAFRPRAMENGSQTDDTLTAAPQSPEITLAADFIDEPTLRGVVARFLAEEMFEVPAHRLQLTFKCVADADLALPADAHEFEILPEASPVSPQIPLRVNVFQGRRIVATVRLTAAVAIEREVLIVQRHVSRGEEIAPADLQPETRFVEPHPSRAVGDVALAAGQKARGRLVPGQILRKDDLEAPIAIARGADAILCVRSGPFVLRMDVRALDEGRVGEVIRVRRVSDRVEFLALVEPGGELTLATGLEPGLQGEER